MDHRSLLIEAIRSVRERNPMFSLRAMAKKLAVSPAHLSQVLSGKRPITLRVALNIAEQFKMPAGERAQLLQLVTKREQVLRGSKIENLRYLDEQEFSPISDWYYFAILSMGQLSENQASPRWMAQRLGLPFLVVRLAYEKLKHIGLIEEKDGRFFQTTKPLHTSKDLPSAVVRKYHKQNLDLAKEKIDQTALKLREFSSITVAVNSRRVPQAKKLIHEFKIRLGKLLKNGELDEVYTLAIQLFPVTKNISQQKNSHKGGSHEG